MNSITKTDAAFMTNSDTIMLRRENEQLQLLNELATEIGLSHNPNEIVDKTLVLLQQCINVEEAFFVIDFNDQYQRLARETQPRATTREHRKVLTEYVLTSIQKNYSIQTIDLSRVTALAELAEIPLPIVIVAPLEHQDVIYGALVMLTEEKLLKHEHAFLERLVKQIRGFLFHALTFKEERDYLLLKQDIRIASEIQQQLLPKSTPLIEGFDIYGETRSSHQVGGDYYDYLTIGKNRLGICIGDATGKGIPAALIMANLQATMRSLVLTEKPVQEYMALANGLLFNSTDLKKYASLFFARLNFENKTIRYSNAGHNPPLLLGCNGETERLRTGGAPLGIISALYYREDTVYMNEGDILFMYSDGILEAIDAEDEETALVTLESFIRKHSERSAKDISAKVIDYALNASRGGLIQDDMTLVIIKRTK